MRGGAGYGLRSRVGEPVGVADDELFESITSVKVCGAELLKLTLRRNHRSARIFGLFRDREPQLDVGSEELAQYSDHLPAQFASDPILGELTVHREVQFVTVKRNEADRLDPHLEDRLRKRPF